MDYLEHLAALLSCDYLSDLRFYAITQEQARRILLEPERYPPEQYAESARYILGSDGVFASSLEARQAIVSFLQRHKEA